MVWRLLVCVSIAIITMLASWADTLVVAGHTSLYSTPFVSEQGDVLAPLLPALRLLGASTTVSGSTVTVTAVGGSSVVRMTAGSTAAVVDGKRVRLAVAPRLSGGEFSLPAKALAPYLGAAARFDEASRTLSLLPLITVTSETRAEGVAILVRSHGALQFTSGSLDNPPRRFFDFKGVALKSLEQITVGAGRVDRVRMAPLQDATGVRLVVDLTEAAGFASTVSEQGRLVTILVTEPKEEEKDATPEQPAAAKIAPFRLLGANLKAHSTRVSALTITTDGPAQAESTYDKDTRTLTINLPQGINALERATLDGLRDKIVERLVAQDLPDKTGVSLSITLKSDSGYLIQQDTRSLRILMGTFDVSDMLIVLDAGHGGHDSGAVGVNGTKEKTVNLDVILRTAKLLEQAGATVLLSREDDTFITLDNRPALANGRNADLFISVHCNSTARPNTASGTQTYYTTPQSAQLAEVMQKELVQGLGLRDGGVHTARFLVIRKSLMPAVLLELGFLSSSREEALLADADFRQQAAEAILAGVRRYATTQEWQLRKSATPTPLNDAAVTTGGDR